MADEGVPEAEGTLLMAGTIAADGAPGHAAGSVVLQSTHATNVSGLIHANGLGANSPGGSVRILSQGTASLGAGGRVEARGGSTGAGGQVELSGRTVGLHGRVDVAAPGGTPGRFLLDPLNLSITNDGPDGSGTEGDTVSAGALESITEGTIVLQATNDITIQDLSGGYANGSLTLAPNVSLSLEAVSSTPSKVGMDPGQKRLDARASIRLSRWKEHQR